MERNVIFYVSKVNASGEVEFKRVEKTLVQNAPIRVNPVVSYPKTNTDPTLIQFHEKLKPSDYEDK